jgi:hypothetical protein
MTRNKNYVPMISQYFFIIKYEQADDKQIKIYSFIFLLSMKSYLLQSFSLYHR